MVVATDLDVRVNPAVLPTDFLRRVGCSIALLVVERAIRNALLAFSFPWRRVSHDLRHGLGALNFSSSIAP